MIPLMERMQIRGGGGGGGGGATVVSVKSVTGAPKRKADNGG